MTLGWRATVLEKASIKNTSKRLIMITFSHSLPETKFAKLLHLPLRTTNVLCLLAEHELRLYLIPFVLQNIYAKPYNFQRTNNPKFLLHDFTANM